MNLRIESTENSVAVFVGDKTAASVEVDKSTGVAQTNVFKPNGLCVATVEFTDNSEKDYFFRDDSEEAIGINCVPAVFRSIWDDYSVVLESKCHVNMDTREVFNIETCNIDIDMNFLDKEEIVINEDVFPVFHISEAEDGDFWYK